MQWGKKFLWRQVRNIITLFDDKYGGKRRRDDRRGDDRRRDERRRDDRRRDDKRRDDRRQDDI